MLDYDQYSSHDDIGSASIKMMSAKRDAEELHRLTLTLSKEGLKDSRVQRPLLFVSTKYLTCKTTADSPISESSEGPADSPPPLSRLGSLGNDAAEREDIGILTVKELELVGVESLNAGTMVGNKIYIKISVGNNEVASQVKINKSHPWSVTWLESFYFNVPAPRGQVLRLTVMRKAGSVTSGLKTMGTFGMAKTEDQPIGFLEVDLTSILKSPSSKQQHFAKSLSSDDAHGEINATVSLAMHCPD